MKRVTLLLCSVLTIVLQFAIVARAEDWKDAARKVKLTSDEIRQLGRDKVLITKRHCRQVFSLYVEPEMPVFVTSDSILNAYHVLLEESILQLEQANTEKLPVLLERLWNELPRAERGVGGNGDVVSAARRHAQVIVGTALDLLGRRRSPVDPKTEEFIRTETKRVEAASGQNSPSWLDKSDNEYQIDHSRYTPRGFYTQFDSLVRYFRAVAWLQSIPFRVGRDDELLAVLMLGNSLRAAQRSDDAKGRQLQAFFECFREFIGDRDDWDLTVAAEAAEKFHAEIRTGDLGRVRLWLTERAKQAAPAAINDLVIYRPLSLSFRVLSAYRTPDAVLFQRTTGVDWRPFPTGLDICIALGSEYAARSLSDPQKDRVLSEIEKSKPLLSGSSLYLDELHCMSTLFDRPPAGAPLFMRSDVWQAKSCTTALAAWAQLRHTWILQTKQTIVVLCAEDRPRPVGFVEPNPAFFADVMKMSHRAAQLLDRIGLKNQPRSSTLEKLGTLAALQNLLRFLEHNAASGKGFDRYSWENVNELDTLHRLMGKSPKKLDPKDAKTFYRRAIAITKEVIADVQQGTSDRYQEDWSGHRWRVEELWPGLSKLCGRLQQLAEKELATSPFKYGTFTEDDRDFILAYGKALAPLMFHVGDASECPRDDAPRIIDVFSNPDSGECLEVGIGRPQILYMLYPTTDGEVFCRGAVLPYYEFRSPTRLDDIAWKQSLDSANPPSPPSWSSALVAGPEDTFFCQQTFLIVVSGVLVLGICIAIVARRRRGSTRPTENESALRG
jgi:hypothetical protein